MPYGSRLADAGLAKSDLDGLITCKSFGGFGIDTEIGRLAGTEPAIQRDARLRHMQLLAAPGRRWPLRAGSRRRSRSSTAPTSGPPATDSPTAAGSGAGSLELHGFHNIAGQAAMAFTRHAHLYGTTEEQLGWVAVTERAHAQLNPLAIFQDAPHDRRLPGPALSGRRRSGGRTSA